MASRPSSQPSSQPSSPRYQNGSRLPENGAAPGWAPPALAEKPAAPNFFAPFLGAFAAVLVVAGIGLAVYFGVAALHSSNPSSTGPAKNLLQDTTTWQLGQQAARNLDGQGQSDIGWWTRSFDLPKPETVTAYLQQQGLTVTKIEPAHYENATDGTTITYNVEAAVPHQLFRVQQTSWHPNEPSLARFANILTLNQGLPAGTLWNTPRAAVAAEAGTKLNFAWQIHWDKTANVVTTDRLPFSDDVFTQEQVNQFQSEASNTIAQLRGEIQQIDAQVQRDTEAKLAQVPANPPKPELLSSRWGGDGSGEPTKSAERIGGGTAAGAAGGAAFGAAAGDAGLGAGIGAGVGLLGGFIYDTVSKNNDKERYRRKVAAENEERMDGWRAQVRELNNQRDQVKRDAVTEKEQLLSDLASRISANGGRLEGVSAPVSTPVATPTQATPPQDAPPAQPTSDQPSGPLRQP